MQSKNAIGNLKNRYRSVLKKCNLLNVFGSLAVVGMLTIGAGSSFAITVNNGLDVQESNQNITVPLGGAGTSYSGGFAISVGTQGQNPGDNGGNAGTATANSNTLTFENGSAFSLFGGSAESLGGGGFPGSSSGDGNIAEASGNILLMKGGSVENVYGGIAISRSSDGNPTGSTNIATANNNKVTIQSGTVNNDVYGGSAQSLGVTAKEASASGNTVIVENNASVGNVIGGEVSSRSNSNKANNNIVHIYGEADNVYGAFTSRGSGGHFANENKVYIHGGASVGSIYGARGFIESEKNIVSLNGAITFEPNVTIAGSEIVGVSKSTGNTLILDSFTIAAGTIQNVASFETYNFILPSNTAVGSTILKTTDLNLTDGVVQVASVGNVSIKDGHGLKHNDVIVLIDSTNAIDGTIANNGKTVTSDTSTFTQQEWKINQDNINHDITATFISISAQSRAEVVVSSQTGAANATLYSATGALVGNAIPTAQSATQGGEIKTIASLENEGMSTGSASSNMRNTWAPFAVIQGGYNSFDSGVETDVTSVSFVGGLAYNAYLNNSELLLGFFAETGTGSYNTSAGAIDSDGNINYIGGGLFARYEFNTQNGLPYVEASARLGTLHNDYGSDDIIDPSTNAGISYETDSMYYGMHLGLGYIWNINEQWALDMSAKYFWTHQESIDKEIAGDNFNFDSINSHVLRVGATANYEMLENETYTFSPYFGLHYEHEFDSEAKASVENISIPNSASLEGGTGVLSLGATYSHINGFSLNGKVEGSLGERDGLTGMLELKYTF